MTKLKILHIQETIGSGGVERRRLSLAKHLDKSIFELKIVCQHEVGNIANEIRSQGVDVISLNRSIKGIFDIKQHRMVQKIIDDFRPNIIHGAVFEGVTMAAINGWLKKVPIIIIEETSDPQNRSWKGNILMKLFSKMADKVVGVSDGVTKDYLIGKLNLSDKKAIAINNGVAMPRKVLQTQIREAKKEWGIDDKDFVIGSTGRMIDDGHKRFSDLIKAFALFQQDKEHVKLLLVGDGQERDGYKILTQELGISDKVIFAGYQSDVTLFYKMMDVFALVSAREAFGLVLAEAMLNKLPVIATKVGGMKYIVDHYDTGLLVEKYNIDEILGSLCKLYYDHNLRIEMGEKGYVKALKEFSEEAYVGKVQALYLSFATQI